MRTLTPRVLHGSLPISRNERAVFGTDSAMNACAPQPSDAPGIADSAAWLSLLRRAAGHEAHSCVPQSPLGPVVQHNLYPRTSAVSERSWLPACPPRSDPAWVQATSRRAVGPRWRLWIAGFHSRRPVSCAWSLFFPRSVGLGPTASWASGAFTMAPSILCQAQAAPSRSSYSANPLRQSRTKTLLRFHSKKYLWIELALPNLSSGSAFHWHPVRSTYTMPANTLRGSIGLRPPPGRRRYFRPFSRLRFGTNGATFAQSSSETVQECIALMARVYHEPPKRCNYLFADKF